MKRIHNPEIRIQKLLREWRAYSPTDGRPEPGYYNSHIALQYRIARYYQRQWRRDTLTARRRRNTVRGARRLGYQFGNDQPPPCWRFGGCYGSTREGVIKRALARDRKAHARLQQLRRHVRQGSVGASEGGVVKDGGRSLAGGA